MCAVVKPNPYNMNHNTDTIVLSYNESLLRQSDVDILKGPFWLNDTIISFFFEYLETYVFKNNTALSFVSPEVTQCIKISQQQELCVFLEPLLSNAKKDFIFFALNDHEKIDMSGGSHWSLLVFSRPEKRIFHYDSSSGINELQAFKFGQKILKYFALPVQEKIDNVLCLQQNNGYDCGMHVLCNAENLASFAVCNGKIKGWDCPKLNNETISAKRLEILDIIEKLRVKEPVDHFKQRE
ncbi:unnamed protein product [Phaedon cochleariae]|uniref:Ubiquitin-like protease family profile domain-containing protein n=1 Tax=Phaedon cochleariae TaxID=80249 RepID=A0A9P0GNJ6_PHACE|nr:unnamed protein product [Phaedon cochleariae]